MKLLLAFCLLLILVPAVASSQSLSISLGPAFSLMRPPENYGAWSTDLTGFVMRKEVKIVDGQQWDKGYSGVGRVRFRLPAISISVIGGFAYTRVVGVTEQVLATPPPWSSRLYEEGRLESKADLFTVSGGLRWDVLKTRVVPYITALFSLNRYGETTITIINDRWTSTATMEGVSRAGVALGAGVSFLLQTPLHAEIELGYAMPNAFGRESGEKIREAVSVTVLFSYEVL